MHINNPSGTGTAPRGSVFPKNGIALAPMRALSQPSFWHILNRYGPPDAYFSEFVRVHEHYFIEAQWIERALEAADGRPVWIQLMGNDVQALSANIRILMDYPIAGIDFNVGCPVPKIYKKQAGGGLLRDLPHLRTLLLQIRLVCEKPLSVKFRIGFQSTEGFPHILDILNEARIDIATLHARTVADLYKKPPQYEFIAQAVRHCAFPILANGDLDSIEKMQKILAQTQCYGLMVGRAALRNPWIFDQWHCIRHGRPIVHPTFAQVYQYLEDIYQAFQFDKQPELIALGGMKRFSNYLGTAIDASGDFLQKIRRTSNLKQFWRTCQQALLSSPTQPYLGEPFVDLFSQPNKER